MINNKTVKGFIFDIDGTLTSDNQAIAGAINTTITLRNAGYSLRFITNTTSKTPEQLADGLSHLGFNVDLDEIFTSVTSCIHYLQTHFDGVDGYLAIPDEIRPLFENFSQTEEKPTYVVLGDLDYKFNYCILNKVFNFIREGAQLITFHRNPYYFREGKTWLDSGAFTMALEQITDQKAIVTGKPSHAIFETALHSMGLTKRDVIVVGDDVSSDILGARNVGLKSFLVGSGKFKREQLKEFSISNDSFIEKISDLVYIHKYCE